MCLTLTLMTLDTSFLKIIGSALQAPQACRMEGREITGPKKKRYVRDLVGRLSVGRSTLSVRILQPPRQTAMLYRTTALVAKSTDFLALVKVFRSAALIGFCFNAMP